MKIEKLSTRSTMISMWKSILLLPLLLMACADASHVVGSGQLGSSSSSSSSVSASDLVLVELVSGDDRLTFNVEIADTPGERAEGLMHREEMPQDQGMLFIFEKPEKLSFWMKNTLIDLDILFFDADGHFVSRTTMQPCEDDPCPTYPSEGAAKYALEVNPDVISLRDWKLIITNF